MFPEYTARERFVDGCIHALGVPASIAALTALIVIGLRAELPEYGISLTVYGLTLVAMFAFSAGYNLVTRPRIKAVLRRCDHAAIFAMIAGTYTPIAIIRIGGAWGYGLLAAVWAIAVLGIVLQVVAPRFLARVSLGLYMVQGWLVLVAMQPLVESVSTAELTLLFAGGLLYSIGVVFHVWEKLPYQNAIWHVFVLVGAGCHYAAVVGGAAA